MEVSLVRETHLTSEPTSSTLVVTATRGPPFTFSNALNESNPKTVAWLVTWKLISIGKPPPPPLLCPLEIPFETFDQLSRPTSPPRLGSSIDHLPPSPKYRSLVDATTLSIFQATPFTDHHFHYLVEIVRILSSGF